MTSNDEECTGGGDADSNAVESTEFFPNVYELSLVQGLKAEGDDDCRLIVGLKVRYSISFGACFGNDRAFLTTLLLESSGIIFCSNLVDIDSNTVPLPLSFTCFTVVLTVVLHLDSFFELDEEFGDNSNRCSTVLSHSRTT